MAETTVYNPSSPGIRGDIVVLGGRNQSHGEPLNTVETFNWNRMIWTFLAPMQKPRLAPTSVYYKNTIIVAGGCITRIPSWTRTDETEQFLFDEDQWLDFPVKLPYVCCGHKSVHVLDNDRLLLIGGGKVNDVCSNEIHDILLQPPYTRTLRARIPQPIAYHGAELFNEKILIAGGTTTGHAKDSVGKVLLCDLSNNDCKEMPPLPFAMCNMATVKWGDDSIIIIGGRTVSGNEFNTVLMYNYKEEWCYSLPPMKYKRAACDAVVTGNAIVVMGGFNKEQGCLNTVEYFTFETYSWQDLPAMSEKRNMVTAVVKPFVSAVQ